MPWIGTLEDRKLADPSLRFPHLAIAKRRNPLGGGASDSDTPSLINKTNLDGIHVVEGGW